MLLSTYTVEVFELQSYYILLKFAKKIILAFNKFIRFSATTNLRILLETEFVYLFLCTGKYQHLFSCENFIMVIKLVKLSKNYLMNSLFFKKNY